jgi:hypothetical protein
LSIIAWNVTGALHKPKGITRYSNKPYLVRTLIVLGDADKIIAVLEIELGKDFGAAKPFA